METITTQQVLEELRRLQSQVRRSYAVQGTQGLLKCYQYLATCADEIEWRVVKPDRDVVEND